MIIKLNYCRLNFIKYTLGRDMKANNYFKILIFLILLILSQDLFTQNKNVSTDYVSVIFTVLEEQPPGKHCSNSYIVSGITKEKGFKTFIQSKKYLSKSLDSKLQTNNTYLLYIPKENFYIREGEEYNLIELYPSDIKGIYINGELYKSDN